MNKKKTFLILITIIIFFGLFFILMGNSKQSLDEKKILDIEREVVLRSEQSKVEKSKQKEVDSENISTSNTGMISKEDYVKEAIIRAKALEKDGLARNRFEIVAAYASCARLDDPYCKIEYEKNARVYTALRCKIIKPYLGFFFASDKNEENFVESVEYEGKIYFLETAPVLDGGDFEDIYQIPQKANEEMTRIGVLFTERAKDQLAKASGEKVGKHLCLVSDRKLIRCYFLRQALELNALEISMPSNQAKNLLSSFCAEVERNELPAHFPALDKEN